MRMTILALLVVGCGPTPINPAPEPTAAPEPPSAFQNQIAAMPDGPRNGVFIRAIRDAGLPCQGVVGSSRKGEALNGDPLYVAECQQQKFYGIVMGRDGTALVTTRGDR